MKQIRKLEKKAEKLRNREGTSYNNVTCQVPKK